MPSPPANGTQAGHAPVAADASPTRALFIEMLTRDIGLIPAIVDLVDNCVDGARLLRGKASFDDLCVRVETSPGELRVVDNCGGIDADVARAYAFRFGRPPGAPFVPHSIGRFGVGMKRAFFKVGKHFRVQSRAARSHFVVDVDVEKWAHADKSKEQVPWEFPFEVFEENLAQAPEDKRRTEITITRLHDDVADLFKQTSFEKRLAAEIESRLQTAIVSGLAITLNQLPVDRKPLELLDQVQLLPAYRQCVYGTGRERVTVKLYCGLGPSVPPELAGWHVFCNGRLVLKGDKTRDTGWDTVVVQEGGEKIPGFHPQFHRFRGYAYFDCDDAGCLPWNTTKTALNTDSPVYRAVALEMKSLMRPVIDFLNRLKEEKQGQQDPGEKGPLEILVESAVPKPVGDVATRSAFDMPKVRIPKKPKGPVMQRIQYDKPLEQVSRAKLALGVRSFKEVGEKTFEYWYDSECPE
ncbi:MAG TPA: ATP-binding protein [Planctomycetota bacterium]|nr:ATP-binding protein [Planctomycetota bacterium]